MDNLTINRIKSKPTARSLVLLGVYLLGAMEIFHRGGTADFFSIEKIIYLVLFSVIITIWLLKQLVQKEFFQVFEEERCNWLVLAFLAYSCIFIPIIGIYYDTPMVYAFRSQLRFLNLLLIPVIYSEVNSKESIWHFFIYIFLIIIIISILDIFYIRSYDVPISLYEEDYELRSCFYMASIPILIALFQSNRLNTFKVAIFMILLLFFMYRYYLRYGRFHFAGLVMLIGLALFIQLVSKNGSRGFILGFLGFSLLLVLIISYLQINYNIFARHLERFRYVESGAMGRLEEWKAGMQLFYHNPLFGGGGGRPITFLRGGIKVTHAYTHNIIVWHLTYGGIIGFFLYFSIWWRFFSMSWRLLRRVRLEQRDFIVLTGCLLSASYLLANSMLQTFFLRQEANFLFAVCIALVLCIHRNYRHELVPVKDSERAGYIPPNRGPMRVTSGIN